MGPDDPSRPFLEALEALPVGIVIRDGTGTEVFRNAVGASPTGDVRGDALVRGALEALVGTAAVSPHSERLELRGPPPRSVELMVVRLPSGGVVGVIQDVSESTRVERVRRDFIANVSHELRTPVGAIGLLAETLENERDPAVVERLVTRLNAEAARARMLIDDLLELGRLESGERAAPGALDVAAACATARERVAAIAERRGVEINLAVEGEVTIDGSEDEIVSAVVNLLDNAVKYSPAKSRVDVTARASSDTVEIEVVDHGVGIPAKDLDRIFERFYRVDRARDRRTGGSGLGLAIVRHVAQNHGGDVNVRSIEGEGSSFCLRLARGAPA